MASGKKLNREEVLGKIKVGEYIRWKPLPTVDATYEYHKFGFKSFVGQGDRWQYGLVLDVLESPRKRGQSSGIAGLHLQLLKNGEIDWIFNFEHFEQIEIIGKLDED
jgi:hypothetical protein|tara:strand:+ start:189 stop:509 length:321 start_codon:yes stop_codon:yes gene_type:complete